MHTKTNKERLNEKHLIYTGTFPLLHLGLQLVYIPGVLMVPYLMINPNTLKPLLPSLRYNWRRKNIIEK